MPLTVNAECGFTELRAGAQAVHVRASGASESIGTRHTLILNKTVWISYYLKSCFHLFLAHVCLKIQRHKTHAH